MAKDGQPGRAGRLAQVRTAWRMTRQADPRMPLVVAAVGVGVLAVLLVVGLVAGQPVYFAVLGLPLALLAGMVVFSRRAERAAYRQLEGQPGAAAAVLGSLRRGWTVTPAVALNRNQDVVHRVVGRAGIVLVGEGAPSRVTHLMAAERRKLARVAGPEVPIHELLAGDGEGQVPLRRLQARLVRLPRALRPGEVSALNNRLRAMPTQPVALPKGPLPRGARLPRPPRPR